MNKHNSAQADVNREINWSRDQVIVFSEIQTKLTANNEEYYDKQMKINGNYSMFLQYIIGCFFLVAYCLIYQVDFQLYFMEMSKLVWFLHYLSSTVSSGCKTVNKS